MTSSTTPVSPLLGGGHDRARQRMRILNGFLDYGVFVALAALFIGFAIASPYFLLPRNLLNIGSAVALSGIVAAGMTFALVAGVVDLSVGSLLGLVSVVVATQLVNGLPVAAAIGIGFLVCIAAGLVNCLLVVGFGINSIVATLATATVLAGLALMVSNGAAVTLPPTGAALTDAASFRLFGAVPMSLILMLVVYTIGFVVLTRTRFGWHLYAVGSNRSAAVRSGIRDKQIYVVCFIAVSLLVGLAGLLLTGTLGYAQPAQGEAAALDILTAVLLGGVGLAGGTGRIERTLAGILLLGVLSNGLTLLSAPPFYAQIARGIILVAAVVMDALRTKRLAR